MTIVPTLAKSPADQHLLLDLGYRLEVRPLTHWGPFVWDVQCEAIVTGCTSESSREAAIAPVSTR